MSARSPFLRALEEPNASYAENDDDEEDSAPGRAAPAAACAAAPRSGADMPLSRAVASPATGRGQAGCRERRRHPCGTIHFPPLTQRDRSHPRPRVARRGLSATCTSPGAAASASRSTPCCNTAPARERSQRRNWRQHTQHERARWATPGARTTARPNVRCCIRRRGGARTSLHPLHGSVAPALLQ